MTDGRHDRRRRPALRRVTRPGLAARPRRRGRAGGPPTAVSRSILPDDVEEVPGHGVRGRVRRPRRRGRQGAVGVGDPAACAGCATSGGAPRSTGRSTIFVDVDGAAVGALLLDDPIRPDASRTIRQLRRDGIRRIVMVTGDRRTSPRPSVPSSASMTSSPNGHRPRRSRRSGSRARARPNDHGRRRHQRRPGACARRRRRRRRRARRDRLVRSRRRRAHRRSSRPARRSGRHRPPHPPHRPPERRRRHRPVARRHGRRRVGYLPPAWGALLQEVIDVAVILNALRALAGHDVGEPAQRRRSELARRFSAEHRTLRPDLARIRDGRRPPRTAARARRVPRQGARDPRFLVEELDPHEASRGHDLYPAPRPRSAATTRPRR